MDLNGGVVCKVRFCRKFNLISPHKAIKFTFTLKSHSESKQFITQNLLCEIIVASIGTWPLGRLGAPTPVWSWNPGYTLVACQNQRLVAITSRVTEVWYERGKKANPSFHISVVPIVLPGPLHLNPPVPPQLSWISKGHQDCVTFVKLRQGPPTSTV